VTEKNVARTTKNVPTTMKNLVREKAYPEMRRHRKSERNREMKILHF